jgi:hypothetical protein
VFRSSRFDFLRSRIVWIAGVAVLAITVLGLGLYLTFRPQPQAVNPSAPASAGPQATDAAPSLPPVGAQTVAEAATIDVLSVIATTPTVGSSGAAANTTIGLGFNLPVDPAAAASYFSVLPTMPGSFSQGATPRDIVFTPSEPFELGSSVSVVLRKGFTSRDGYALQDDYSFSFITAASPADVLFQVGDQLARLYNAQSGRSVTVTLQFGDAVPPDITLETFRASASDLLAAQVYDATGAYVENPIATAQMQSLARVEAANGGSYTVTQPDGIYLLLATKDGGQYGAMWLDFSRFGVILRQDDQRIVLAGQDLITGATTPAFDVTFFSFQGSVQAVLSGSFTGTGEFAAPYSTHIDAAVATSDGEDVVIPIAIPQTNADIKVVGDLSTQPQIFLTTDRAGYQKGETVKFAGVARLSNDQAYTIPAGMTIGVWSGYGPDKLVDEAVTVAADGSFAASFAMPAAAFNEDGTDGQITLLAGTTTQQDLFLAPYSTVIGTLGDHAPAARISIAFDKSTYVLNDTITASVSGVDSSGKPLAAKSLTLTIYATGLDSKPSELDNFAAPTSWGWPVQENANRALDANGHATYTFKGDVAGRVADQAVTLTASYGSGRAAALGARTAIIHQAAAAAFLLPSRTVYQPGDSVIAPFVVETTAGQRVPNLSVTYQFDRTEYDGSNVTTTVVASGTLTTDANGLGTVRTVYQGPVGEVLLRIKGRDAAGNVFEDARPITVTDNPASLSFFGTTDTLMQLSVSTDKIAYTTGDTAHLVVTSPAARQVFLSLERGRIHLSRWVSLVEGDNPLALTISPDLAPGFTLTFSYFRDGSYITEGLPIRVNNSDRLLKVNVVPDRASYAAGETAHLTITITDSAGAPVAATLLVDAFDVNMSAYKLVDEQSIAGTFFSPAVRGTNGSSSLVGTGNWGGRCGGGEGGPQPPVTNPGHLAAWLTGVTTDVDGQAFIDVPLAQGSVRFVVFAATTTTLLGQAQMDLSVQ